MFCSNSVCWSSDRKSLQSVKDPAGDRPTHPSSGTDGIFDVSTFVLRLLPSKDGAVLRRLLVTAVSHVTLRSCSTIDLVSIVLQ